MKHIYVDHNVVIHVAEANNAKTLEAMDKIRQAEDITVAVSLWNLVEAAGGNEKEQALNLGSFFDRLHPAWLTDRLALQRQEVCQFVYRHCFGAESPPITAFENHLSQAVAHLGNPEQIAIGETARQFIESLLASPDTVSTIRQAYGNTVAALRTLQDTKKRNELTKELEEQSFKEWMKILLPSRDPRGRALDAETCQKLLHYCTKREILKVCKAVALEHYLSEFRTSDPNRKPEEQDAPDLAHAVQALAYCDVFVTRDGYLNSAAQYVAKYCSFGIAETVDSVENALRTLVERR